MPPPDRVPLDVKLAAWVEEARADPVKLRARQVTEILLHAVGLSPTLQASLVLKGGTLMSLAFGSPRTTKDVDFTATADPDDLPDHLRDDLDRALRRAAAELGYLDLLCRVQAVKYQPRRDGFEACQAPALQVTIGSALRGTGEEARLERGAAPQVLGIDISFKEPLFDARELRLDELAVSLRAYSHAEVIAEKLRALLQQPLRNRGRRQDVYDIAHLLEHNEDVALPAMVHAIVVEKCRARGFEPTRALIDDPAVAERASRDWATLADELPRGTLPAFGERFSLVRAFYHSLPWPEAGESN
ncbi:putative nucleotidyltransferase component of viral defense system [Azospirillum agricola]|uniref:nucleotidyl transferase AbiEii/AbiGii toxin family protein n=1 Tax=Azospirillum agricola TaxID=1720247 RepID=UPI001AE4E8D3|nr:nucleotidyl transferase AbiEii/AbiGii toxin family protein [Azospirillum agricola]MBP2233421.1 putative nucleotidyltransferase component of viral defense system [Azospirillum agricola]